MVIKMKALALCAFAVTAVAPFSAAFADTTPFTSASVEVESLPDGVTGSGYQVQTNSAPASIATKSISLSGDWGSASGFSSADLSTGQLKVEAALPNPSTAPTPSSTSMPFLATVSQPRPPPASLSHGPLLPPLNSA